MHIQSCHFLEKFLNKQSPPHLIYHTRSTLYRFWWPFRTHLFLLHLWYPSLPLPLLNFHIFPTVSVVSCLYTSTLPRNMIVDMIWKWITVNICLSLRKIKWTKENGLVFTSVTPCYLQWSFYLKESFDQRSSHVDYCLLEKWPALPREWTRGETTHNLCSIRPHNSIAQIRSQQNFDRWLSEMMHLI